MYEGVSPGCMSMHLTEACTMVVGAGFVTVPPPFSFSHLGNWNKPGGLEDCPGCSHHSLAEAVSDSCIAHRLAFLFSGW